MLLDPNAHPRPNYSMPADDQTIENSHGISENPIVRETVCKTILNRSGLSDYSLNCYTGCTHACVYCYARFMQRFHPHDERWGAFVDVKVNPDYSWWNTNPKRKRGRGKELTSLTLRVGVVQSVPKSLGRE